MKAIQIWGTRSADIGGGVPLELICSDEDVVYLPLVDWRVVATGRVSARTGARAIQVRGRWNGMEIYPHHLVYLAYKTSAGHVAELVGRGDVVKMREELQIMGKNVRHINQNVLDVTRSNLQPGSSKGQSTVRDHEGDEFVKLREAEFVRQEVEGGAPAIAASSWATDKKTLDQREVEWKEAADRAAKEREAVMSIIGPRGVSPDRSGPKGDDLASLAETLKAQVDETTRAEKELEKTQLEMKKDNNQLPGNENPAIGT
jgi:hypothetical protein